MSLGVVAGAAVQSALQLSVEIGSGDYSPASILRLLPILLTVWIVRGVPAWRQSLREANLAGQLLSVFALIAAGAAAFISMALLFP
jgi:hypothetical protein